LRLDLLEVFLTFLERRHGGSDHHDLFVDHVIVLIIAKQIDSDMELNLHARFVFVVSILKLHRSRNISGQFEFEWNSIVTRLEWLTIEFKSIVLEI